MSQTETVLLLILGFALASLIALFIGRVAWRLALRRGARNMQKQLPGSLIDMQAERDRLRADYAMLSQKLGSHLETVKTRMAEQMAEVARSRNRVQSLSEDLAARQATVAERDAEIEALKARIATLEADLATARAAAAAANSLATVPDSLQASIAQITSLSGEMAAARAMPEAAAQAPDDLAAKLAETEQETAALQQELSRLDNVWSDKLQAEPAPAVMNVVSLAQRLRGQNKDATG